MWLRRQTENSELSRQEAPGRGNGGDAVTSQALSEFLSQHELETSQNQANSPGEVDPWASGDGAWRAGEDKVVEAN